MIRHLRELGVVFCQNSAGVLAVRRRRVYSCRFCRLVARHGGCGFLPLLFCCVKEIASNSVVRLGVVGSVSC